MDEVWIVFLVGSTGSFALMWAMWSAVSRRKLRRARRSEFVFSGNSRRRFLDALRREAAIRVEMLVQDARTPEAAGRVAHGGSSPETQRLFSETRRTVRQLFSSAAVEAFDEAIAAVKRADSPQHVDRAIERLKAVLEREIGAEPAGARPRRMQRADEIDGMTGVPQESTRSRGLRLATAASG